MQKANAILKVKYDLKQHAHVPQKNRLKPLLESYGTK
jgi:hypothetical protein